MTQNNKAQTATPKRIADDFFGEQDEQALDDEPQDSLEHGVGIDAQAVLVSLKESTHDGENCVEVYAHGKTYPEHPTEMPPQTVLLARVTERALKMFPLVSASYRSDFLTPKYGELTTITILANEDEPWLLPESIGDFDGMLERLPTGFGRHAKYGLGFKWEYRLIPSAILDLNGISELVIEPGDGASIELPKFKLGIRRFSAIKRSLDSITRRSRQKSLRERQLVAFNELLHVADPVRFERQFAKVKPGEIYELVKLGGRARSRSADDRRAAAEVICADAAKIAVDQPSQLIELKAVIEQVTLKELIAKVEDMLSKNLKEATWQAFFKANPFVLGLAFPHPVFLIQDQAHVGGAMLRGVGESIVDFLFALRFTGSLALIEIKRPSTKLIEAKTFRGDLHPPHKELTSAMAQVLDQRFQLLHNYAAKSHDPALIDTHVSAVHCIVIAGKTPVTMQEKRSFDLFRHSSKDVIVVTFDELLGKLREILRLMTADDAEPPGQSHEGLR